MIAEFSGDLLQWLRGFYFVAKTESVTQAAVMMGRQQPAVTHQVKCLEKELGATLFDRSSGKMKLSPEGRVLFEKAISLFEVLKEIRSEFGKEQQEYQGKIIIATSHVIMDYYLPQHILKFRNSHPRVNFDIEGGVYEWVFERVESGEADFGIGNIDSLPKTIVYHDLFENSLKLIAPKNNPFFSGKSPTLRQIAQVPLILFSHRGLADPSVVRRFAQENLKLNIVMTHNNFLSVKKYVALGLGASILGSHSISKEDQRKIDIFPLHKYFPVRRYGVLLRKRKYLSPAVKAFIRTMKPDIQFTQ